MSIINKINVSNNSYDINEFKNYDGTEKVIGTIAGYNIYEKALVGDFIEFSEIASPFGGGTLISLDQTFDVVSGEARSFQSLPFFLIEYKNKNTGVKIVKVSNSSNTLSYDSQRDVSYINFSVTPVNSDLPSGAITSDYVGRFIAVIRYIKFNEANE